MTDGKIRDNIRKTASDIEQWAGETEKLTGEIAAFLEEMRGSGTVSADSGDPDGDPAEILAGVMRSLEEIKAAMTGLKER